MRITSLNSDTSTRTKNDIAFIETIRCKNGLYELLNLHQERVNQTLSHFHPTCHIDLEKVLPEVSGVGLWKCKMTYGKEVKTIEVTPYVQKKVASLKVIEANDVEYTYKYKNRAGISKLLSQKGECDDILISQQGSITDGSYFNVLFEKDGRIFTPKTCLLKGVQRTHLIRKNIITETDITVNNMAQFNHVLLINAMIPLNEAISLRVSSIQV